MATASDILVIPLEGDLDVASVPRVRSYLEQRIAEGCTRVILNLACTEYVDSLGMGLILATARRLADRGGQLSLICVSDDVYRMLCICRLVDFIPVRRNAPSLSNTRQKVKNARAKSQKKSGGLKKGLGVLKSILM